MIAAGAAILGSVSQDDRPNQNLLLGTVQASVTRNSTSCSVLLDGASTPITGLLTAGLVGYLKVNTRVMGCRVGGRFYVTDVVGGTSVNLPDTDWVNMTLLNSWVNFDSGLATGGSGRVCRYCRINGIVYIEGVCKSGINNTVCFALPSGFRPAALGTYESSDVNSCGGGFAFVSIDGASGNINLANSAVAGSNVSTFTYLKGISPFVAV